MKTKAGAFMKTESNSAPAVYDWNNDGLLDILSGAEGSLPSAPLPPLLFINIGTNTKPEFADAVKIKANNVEIGDAERFNIDVADLNYDGKQDLLIGAGWSAANAIFYENSGTKENPVLKKGVNLKNMNGTDIKLGMDLKVYVTDWNEDGGLDLLLGHLEKADGIDIYLGEKPPTLILNNKSVTSFLRNSSLQCGYYKANLYLNNPGNILLQVFSVTGRMVESMNMGNLPAGANVISYDMNIYPAGYYLINIIAGEKTINQNPIFLVK